MKTTPLGDDRMGLWLEKGFQAFAYFESKHKNQDSKAAVAELIKTGAFAWDFLDGFHPDFVGDAVADDFNLYAFNSIAEKFVAVFHFYLRYNYGIWVRG